MGDEIREVLVLRGHLDRAGRFTPRRCRSTHRVGAWPVVEDSPVTAELLDAQDRVLHREKAEVTPEPDCRPGDAQRFRLRAYIELRPDAAAVRLLRDDLLLWHAEIPPPAKLSLNALKPPSRRRGPIVLGLRYSEPGPGAHMLVVYRWGAGRFRVVYLGPPESRIEIDAGALPGGDECVLAVSYSNGLRSAHAATRPFRVPRRGPSLAVVQPARGSRFVAGTPVILEASLIDEERAGGAGDGADLLWQVDGVAVGQGLLNSIDGLDQGLHEITVRYCADPGAEASVKVRAVRPKAPTAAQWDEWDPMADDRIY